MFRCKKTDCTTFVYLQIAGLIFWCGIGIVMIIMGGLYKDDCPIQPIIPVFLIITGVAQIVVSGILLLRALKKCYTTVLDTAIFLFTVGWFITGSFWVFSMFDQKDGKCARNLYLFAYGIMAFEWIILWVACIYYFCYSNSERSTTQASNKKKVSFSDTEGEPLKDMLAATASESSPETTGWPTSGNRTTHTQGLNRNTQGFNKN